MQQVQEQVLLAGAGASTADQILLHVWVQEQLQVQEIRCRCMSKCGCGSRNSRCPTRLSALQTSHSYCKANMYMSFLLGPNRLELERRAHKSAMTLDMII